MNEKRNSDKLQFFIDYRILYTISLFLMIIPIVQPIGLPMKISNNVEGYYNSIKDLPRGSVILFENWVDLKVWDEIEPIITVTWKILWNLLPEQDINIIIYSPKIDIKNNMDKMFSNKLKPPQWRAETYGITWVDLGYIVGMNKSGLRMFASDFSTMVMKDSKGTHLMDIPVIKEVAAKAQPVDVINFYDFDLSIWGSSICTSPDTYVGAAWYRGNPPYHLPMLFITTSRCFPWWFKKEDPIRGVVAGFEEAAELEYLSGFKGEAIKKTDFKSIGGLSILLLLVPGILGNIVYFGKRLLRTRTSV